MVRRKYADDSAIQNKIDDLFTYRKIKELIQLGQLTKNKAWISQLYQIQTQIYLLDAYLETNWDLEPAQISAYWSGIMAALEQIGYTGKRAEKLVTEIRRYEKIETDCRRNKWPTRVDNKSFYTTKSCDVRLIRHLVYAAAPDLKWHWKENVWKYYDLITEINDDVADVMEDVDTYNGNRYLISILRKGIRKTTSRYADFIEEVTVKANSFFAHHPKQERDHQLHEWIILRSQETLQLLHDSASQLDIAQLANAKVLRYMT